MAFLKNKYFLPICLAGVLAGYGAAEWIMPRYFQPPTQQNPLTANDILAAIGSQPQYYRQTATGNYLAGQFAQQHKDWDKASNYIGRVLERDPDNIDLQKHAMVLAMASGQVNRAVAMAGKIVDQTDDNLLAVMFLALDNFREDNYIGAVNTLDKAQVHNVAAFIIPVLKLWADTAKGQLDLKDLNENSFYAYHAMLAGIYLNKETDVIEYALKSFGKGDADLRDLEKSADLFAALGQSDKAQEIYQLISDKGFANDTIKEKLAKLKSGEDIADLIKLPQIKSPKDGAAIVFLDMAEILLRENSDDSATIFGQMSLALNPDLDESKMIIGYILARNERPTEAIDYFNKIKPESDFYLAAQRQIADLYTDQDKNEEAIAILEKLYETNKDVDALIQIGDIYRFQEDYKDAVDAYDKVVNLWDKVPEKYWHVLYARGMAYERLGEYKKSDADLKAALAFRPNHPYLL
ncbi:MAG TPA: tetratricopeptide repeat protein, partial [Alphaproteobacteria bacterium]|nr:tetratricopeptide repeat protein [Alphaproteobacteria bacterium]